MRVEDIAPRGTPAGRLSGHSFGADGVAKRKARKAITYGTSTSAESVAPGEWWVLQRPLAQIAAQTCAADHPELLGTLGSPTGSSPRFRPNGMTNIRVHTRG